MFTLCILFTTLATNTKGMCEGASKQTPDLKILPRWDRATPVLKFLDPPLLTFTYEKYDYVLMWHCVIIYENFEVPRKTYMPRKHMIERYIQMYVWFPDQPAGSSSTFDHDETLISC